MFKRICPYMVLCLLLAGCGNSEQRLSEALYDSAVQCFADGNYNAAKLKLDSIHELHRTDIDIRRKADTLSLEIELKENMRNVAYYDSVLAIAVPELDRMRGKFVSTGDSALLGYNVYIHKTQGKSYLPHTNLLAEVRDNGDLYTVSVFMGRVLDHVSYRVSCEGVYKESSEVPLSSPANNRFDDLGVRWEYVTYKPALQNGTAEFVADYADKRVMVTLNSEKSVYKFYLDKRDKNAIKESVQFASMLKSVNDMRKGRKSAADNVEWIESKLEK